MISEFDRSGTPLDQPTLDKTFINISASNVEIRIRPFSCVHTVHRPKCFQRYSNQEKSVMLLKILVHYIPVTKTFQRERKKETRVLQMIFISSGRCSTTKTRTPMMQHCYVLLCSDWDPKVAEIPYCAFNLFFMLLNIMYQSLAIRFRISLSDQLSPVKAISNCYWGWGGRDHNVLLPRYEIEIIKLPCWVFSH